MYAVLPSFVRSRLGGRAREQPVPAWVFGPGVEDGAGAVDPWGRI
ncbi:hypothetical protein [Nocardia cyriacigeorgica]|nr:hypothetical protein [Nocardia cyriacigeorgica]